MRFMSVWERPTMAPTAMEATATTASRSCQSHRMAPRATYMTRMSPRTATIFVAIDMKAVTGDGAPV